MKENIMPGQIFSCLFGLLIFTIGILNLFLIHPVPGLVYLLLSCLYFRPVNGLFRQKLSFSVPVFVKILLGFFIIWFTLGISDLGDMIDKL